MTLTQKNRVIIEAMSDTIRERIIKENLAKIAENVCKLNYWERDFYCNVKNLNPELFTPKQFNRIKELAEKFGTIVEMLRRVEEVNEKTKGEISETE